jgi:hypothetical protein
MVSVIYCSRDDDENNSDDDSIDNEPQEDVPEENWNVETDNTPFKKSTDTDMDK